MIRARPARPLAAALCAALLAACAGPARSALDALGRGDSAAAAARTGGPRGLAARRPGDAWGRLAAALVARRDLDRDAEAEHLLAAATAAPRDPVALVALRRLAELADESPAIARRIEAALAPALARGRFGGIGAYRARVARIAAAEVLGDLERVARLRAENGAVSAWTLAGPFGVLRALDFVRPFPPDSGVLPASVPAPLGGAARPARPLPAPDGTVSLEGEPMDGDVFYLAADVTLARGGDYLVTIGTSMSVRVEVDGALIHERRDFAAHLPAVLHVPVGLAAGPHRLLVKVARSLDERQSLHLAFARADGSASDASAVAPPPGAAPPQAARRPSVGAPALGAVELASALTPGAGQGLAALLAGLDAASFDREAAKALLARAGAALPASADVRVARAAVLAHDGTLDEQVARARAEAELRAALERDPGHAQARVALATVLLDAGRLDDADEALAPLAGTPARSPAVALALARAAEARGLPEEAERLAAEASAGGACKALDLARSLAARRRAVTVEDERARALAECRDGRSRLADQLRRHGDPAGAAGVLAPVVRARPWDVEASFALADAHVAADDPGGAAAVLEALRAIWPRSARTEKKLADALELAGDAKGARAARERALAAEGADLALRRALALEDGREVLDAWAEGTSSALRAYREARPTGDTSSVTVLDAAAVELHPGGAYTERTHQLVHVLDPQGVEQFGEVRVPPGAEVLTLRTLKPDGRSVEPERAGAGKGTVSLAGLEPGDFVDMEYVRSVRGDGAVVAADPFFFRAEGTRLFRSTYVVAAPEGLEVGLDAQGIATPAPVRERGAQVFRVEAREVAAEVPEPNQPPNTELMPFLRAGLGGGLEALQADLSDAAAGRLRSTAELRELAARVRAAAGRKADRAALVAAAWAQVSREILGHGIFAEDASVVLSRGRGSRLVVLQAVLAELGIRSRIALARPFDADPAARRFPAHSTWSRPLLRIEAGAEPIWLDASLRWSRPGVLPGAVLGSEALVLAAPGEPLVRVPTPERSAVPDGREVDVRIVLAADGSATVEGEDRYAGAAGAAAKEAVERVDANERRQVVEGMLARAFPGLTVLAAEFRGEGDPGAPLAVRWRAQVPQLARAGNGGLIVPGALFPSRLGARYVQVAARATPLLVSSPERIRTRIVVEAPEGFVPEPGAPVSVQNDLGAYARQERAEGRTLVREDRLELARGRIPPARYPELGTFASTADRGEARPMLFARVPGAAPPPAGSGAPAIPIR